MVDATAGLAARLSTIARDERRDRHRLFLDGIDERGAPCSTSSRSPANRCATPATDLDARIWPRLREADLRSACGRPAPRRDAIFLHRKLAGLYLLAARLGARVNVQALVRPHLGSGVATSPKRSRPLARPADRPTLAAARPRRHAAA
jgi:hypothetical protein